MQEISFVSLDGLLLLQFLRNSKSITFSVANKLHSNTLDLLSSEAFTLKLFSTRVDE